MRDRLLVANAHAQGSGKLLLAYAGEQVLLVDAGTVKVLPSPPPSSTTPQTTPTPVAAAAAAPKSSGKAVPEGLGQVEAVALSHDGTKAAALYRHKVLALWDIGAAAVATLLAHRVLPKKAYALLFAQLTNQVDVLLVNDKVGDVRAYHATADMLPKASALMLGHTASVGTCLDLSPNGTCLASGDRDEKVRLSQFPCTLIVKGYLTGHDNFISAVRFLADGRTVLTASGDGTLALWDAQTSEEKAHTAVPVAATTNDDAPPTKRDGNPRKATSNTPVPCAIAICPGDVAVVTVLGQPHLYVYALPSLELLQTLDTPSPPLGVAVVRETVYVTVGAPEYMLAYAVSNHALALVPGEAVATAVQAHGMAQGLHTEVTVDEGDEGLLGGLTKENLEMRHEWNNRQRKDEFVEKARQKKREKRQKERDERLASETKRGKVDEAAATAKEA